MYFVYSRRWGYYNFRYNRWQDDLDSNCYTDNYALACGRADTKQDASVHTSIMPDVS